MLIAQWEANAMKLLMHICCAPCANMPIDALRADMNGEFKTVNERISNSEREHLQLREEMRELRREEP